MLSKSCEYAIRAMIFISQKVGDVPKASVKEIATNINAPIHFIAKILQELCKKKILQSIKGPNGGFYLEKKDLKITLAQIVLTIDGDNIYKQCILGLKECSSKKPCPVHNQYKEIRKEILTMLENNTISNFNDKLNTGKYFLKNN